jgi:phosphohistidine phosphatase
MKRLILIRHGDAARNPDNDLERTLSPIGEKQAAISGNYLKSYKIDNILCSPTKRTRQTLKLIQDQTGLGDNVVEFVNSIYSNSVETLLSLVAGTNSTNETMLIVGHNPSLLELAIMYDLAAEEKWQNELTWGLRPAEVIVIEFEAANRWAEAVSGSGKIKDIFVPSWS